MSIITSMSMSMTMGTITNTSTIMTITAVAAAVMITPTMSAIPEAVQIARNTRRISWQNVYFALAIKFIVMIMGLFGFANMWIAVFADTGVSMLCLLNPVRILRMK